MWDRNPLPEMGNRRDDVQALTLPFSVVDAERNSGQRKISHCARKMTSGLEITRRDTDHCHFDRREKSFRA